MKRISALIVGLPIGAIIGVLIFMIIDLKKEQEKAIQALKKQATHQMYMLRVHLNDSAATVLANSKQEMEKRSNYKLDSAHQSHLRIKDLLERNHHQKFDSLQKEHSQLKVKALNLEKRNKALTQTNQVLNERLKKPPLKVAAQRVEIGSKPRGKPFFEVVYQPFLKKAINHIEQHDTFWNSVKVVFRIVFVALLILGFLFLITKRYLAPKNLRTRIRWPLGYI